MHIALLASDLGVTSNGMHKAHPLMLDERSPQALANPQVIGDYIARDNQQRAASFVAALF